MADTTEEVSDTQLTFKVKTSGDGGGRTITMAESATVEDLKKKLAGEDMENIPIERQRLIYSGRVMKNEDTLATYKIKAGNTIHLVKSAASNRAPPASSGSSSGPAQPAVPANMAAGTSANNILAGLTGARFAGHAPLPSADIFGPDGGMNPQATEEQLAEMLQNPALAQSMNEALNNPQFVDFMIQSNPMLRAMPNAREVLQSPQFRHMMTDVESLRMAARMRRMLQGGGPGSANAFPAPGATDNTPAGAPATTGAATGEQQGASAGVPAQGPFGLWNQTLLGTIPGPGAAAGGNPFAMLFGPLDAAPQGQQQTQGAAQGGAAAARSPAAAPAAAAAAGGNGSSPNDPFAALWGTAAAPPGAPGNLANPLGMTPDMMQQFMQMMGRGAGAGADFGAPPAAPPDNRPPEERYAEQLRQLNDMGFFDFDRNVAALRRSGGSVQGAVEHLLNS